MRDEAKKDYSFTCNIVRDFVTEKSGIPLKGQEKLELTAGFKVFQSPTYTFPLYEDFRSGLVFTAVENPKAAFNALSAGAVLSAGAALLTLFSF